MKKKKFTLLIGIILVVISLYLGIEKQSNHFYEITLLGLLLALVPLVPKGVFTIKNATGLYFLFLACALWVDFGVELLAAHMWYYSYSNVGSYFVLYGFIYPAGGFIMLISYILAREYISIGRRHPVEISQKILWCVFFVLILVSVASVLFKNAIPQQLWPLLFSASTALIFGLPVFILSERWYKKSFIRDLFSNPLGCLAGTAVATYLNFPLHEYPNAYAHEWVYVVHTGTFLDTLLFGIPFIVWLAWPSLVLASVSFYYLAGGKEIDTLNLI